MSQNRSSSSSAKSPAPVVVLGAGIIGLTTAVRLLESPLIQSKRIPIHIIADHLPNDPLDARYASTVAGAHHLSFADDGDERQIRADKRTFEVMSEEWRKEGEKTGLMRLRQTEFYVGTKDHLKIFESHPDFIINSIPDMNLSFPSDHSIAFTSLTMTPLVYLNRLLTRIHTLGGHIHRAHLSSLTHLSHISTLALIGSAPQAVVVCTGLGSLTLGEVEDKTVYPTRGQIIKVKAPWIRDGYTRQVGSLDGGEGGERTYIIPRSDGEVILGGTREEGDWDPYPRPETSRDIIRRAVEICPDLVPHHRRSGGGGGDNGVEGMILEHLVGFRPSRRDGVRLEQGPDLSLGNDKAKVVHNYGHGGAGWQSCWGYAEDATDLIISSLHLVPKSSL